MSMDMVTEAPKTVFELHQGDCLAGMRQLEAESVDLVVTSPPYNLGIAYSTYKDTEDRTAYLKWCSEWGGEIRRILKSSGSFFLNVGSAPSNPMLPYELVLELSKVFILQNTFHWIKSITVETRQGEHISTGHFKPLQSKRFVTDCHEYVFHFTKTGEVPLDRLAVGVPYADKSNIARWGHTKGKDKRCRGNNWFIPYQTINSRDKDRPHPATFPAELAVQCIKIHGCVPGLVMLDPFLGIGHAAQAAKLCGVAKFIGFEIDGDYIETARQNLGVAPPQKPISKSVKRKLDGQPELF